MPEEKKLFLLDAMSLIYRAYYALNKNPRYTKSGLNTSAILGFANVLYEVIKSERPTHIAVAFDVMAPTKRHEVFEEYKANRQKMPEDISLAIPYIIKLIEAFNINVLMKEGYEADDVIGTIAKKAQKEGYIVYMMTSDKDYGQLVSENIFMYKPASYGKPNQILGVQEVIKKFDIKRTDQVRDILGLWGDASDNIPGVPGIGEVRAKKLIKDFDSIENLIENAGKIDNKSLREKITENKEQALFSKELVTIDIHVPIDIQINKLEYSGPDPDKLKAILASLEFNSFAKRVFSDIKPEYVDSKGAGNQSQMQMNLFGSESPGIGANIESSLDEIKTDYKKLFTLNEIGSFIELLSRQKAFCFDVETSSIDALDCELIGISFAFNKNQAFYIHFDDHYDATIKILKLFENVFMNEAVLKIGQNIKFDCLVLKKYQIHVKGPLFDTMVAHYLLDPEGRHNMDFLSKKYLNYAPIPIETLIGKKGKGQKSMKTLNADEIYEYACEDADVTFQLYQKLKKELESNGLESLYYDLEAPLIPVLTEMEWSGVNVSKKSLETFNIELSEKISQVEKEIFELADETFNIGSPKQLGDVLFGKMKIVEKPQLTKTKQFATHEDYLNKISNKHPVIEKILRFRSLSKLRSTYVDGLSALIREKTSLVHTTYMQTITATGRLSSQNPNLQNIPIRTEEGREIRKSFIPRSENNVILAADYSQVELRIIASLAEDENMIEAFKNKKDIHTATASKLYNVAIEAVTPDMRRNAKTVNFGIIYGISAFGLSERLNISRKEGKEIIDQYFHQYPKIKKYMDNAIEFARSHGYVETIMGRKRYLRDINSRNHNVRSFAERNAINAPIQGSAADIIKKAMIFISNEFHNKKFKTKMILQVHDELVFDVPKTEIEEVGTLIEQNMKKAASLKVPLEVEIKHGKNWLEAH